MAGGGFEHRAGSTGPKLADRVEDPQQRNAEVALPLLAPAIEAFEDGIEVLLAPQTDSHCNVHFGVQHVFPFELFHQAVGDELIVVGALEVFGHCFEGHQKAIEVFVAVELFNLSARAASAVALPELEKSRRINGALQMKMQLCLGKGNQKWTRPLHGFSL